MLNCLTRLGFTIAQMHEIECLTLVDYRLGMEAYGIKQAYRYEELATQAWMNQAIQATKGSNKHPKLVYKKPKDLYDAVQVEDEIRGEYEPDYYSKRQNKKQYQQDVATRFAKLQEIQARRGV